MTGPRACVAAAVLALVVTACSAGAAEPTRVLVPLALNNRGPGESFVPTEAPRTTTPGPGPPATATLVATATPRPTSTRPPVPTATRTPAPNEATSDLYNCSDFESQRDAQAFLRRYPNDPSRLDQNRDGIACENNAGPYDLTPVPRP